MSRLRSEFAAISKSLRKAAARGVAQGAAILKNEVAASCPVETGSMRDSIRVEPGARSRAAVVDHVVVAGGHGEEPVPLHVEYGTDDEPPDPFVRRSVAREERRIRATIEAAIGARLTR